MTRCAAIQLAMALCWCALPRPALAFSEADTFAHPAAAAGGAGRYFTGSPADAYTCKSCHVRGEAPAIRVRGLPLSGYEPGVAYELTVDWSDTLEQVSAMLELTDMNGRRAGTLRLARSSESLGPELCAARSTSAAELIHVPPDTGVADPDYCSLQSGRLPSDCRQVVHVTGCGAKRVRVLWTAPSWNVGPLWLAGSVVSADGDRTNRGDGVSDVGHAIPAPSGEAGRAATAGCSVTAGAAASHAGMAWVALALAGAWRRLARRRNAECERG